MRIVLPPAREHDFHGSGGSEKRQKRVWKQCAAGGVLQERLGRLLGSIFEHFGIHFGSKNRSKNVPESKLNFEVALMTVLSSF